MPVLKLYSEQNKMDLFKNVGMFEISFELIEQEPELVKKIQSAVLIIKANIFYESRRIMYTGSCEQFSEVPFGCIIPMYAIEVTRFLDGECSVQFKLLKDTPIPEDWLKITDYTKG